MIRFFRITLSLLLIFIVIYSILWVRPYRVSGDSMFPSLEQGNLVVADKIMSRVKKLKRGDIIVFREWREAIKIKRIIGLPGETVRISDGKVFLTETDKEDRIIEESYLAENVRTCVPWACTDLSSHVYIVPDEDYFVLGDNRPNSRDSRGCSSVSECNDKNPLYIAKKEILWRVIFSW